MTSVAPVVFVVDDDSSVRDSLRRLISSVGFGVEVFPSAQAFLKARRPDVPGCLVLDVRLPGERRPEEVAADPPEPVDAYPDGQRTHLLATCRAGAQPASRT